MMKNNLLKVSDLIFVGVYSAVYFLFLTIATFASAIIVPVYGMVLIPAFAALLCALPYYLLALKVQKFGAISLMGFIMGAFYFVSGHFPLSFLPAFVFSVLADLIAFKSQYKNMKVLTLSYIVFSFVNSGPILPLYLTKELYIQNLEARGKDAEYIGKLFSQVSVATFIVFVVGTILMAIISSIFSKKMMKKHFEKAGVI